MADASLRRETWSFLLVAAAVGLGCGATAASKPVAEFPKPEVLAQLGTKTAPRPTIEAGQIPPGGWSVELAGAPAATRTPWSPGSAWDAALLQAATAAGRRVFFSQNLACAANEVGRYLLETGSLPPESLSTFMVGACSGHAPRIGIVYLQEKVPSAVAESALLQGWRPSLRSALVDKLPVDASEAGFAFARNADQAVAALVYSQDEAEIEAYAPIPDEYGAVTIRGRIKGDVQYLAGYVNQGRFGVNSCFVDPTVPKPQFQITCQVDGEDEMARIDLLFAPPRRVLASPFARLLARKPDLARLTFSPQPYAESHPVTDAQDFTQFVLQALNRVRGEAGLGPVRLAAVQSEVARSVAAHYFAALSGQGSAEDMDTIALGLLAGWQVTSGMIRNGTFVSTVATDTRDAGAWLTDTLQMPLGRTALLATDIEEIAVGPIAWSDPDLLGSVVVGYQFHHGNDHARDVKRLITRTVLARRQRKLSVPMRLGLDGVMQEELADVHAGKKAPMDALQAVLESGVNKFGANMRGFVVEAASLDELGDPERDPRPTHLAPRTRCHPPPPARRGLGSVRDLGGLRRLRRAQDRLRRWSGGSLRGAGASSACRSQPLRSAAARYAPSTKARMAASGSGAIRTLS